MLLVVQHEIHNITGILMYIIRACVGDNGVQHDQYKVLL